MRSYIDAELSTAVSSIQHTLYYIYEPKSSMDVFGVTVVYTF